MSFLRLRERLEGISGQVRPDKQLETLNPACGLYQTIMNRTVDNSNGLVEQVVAILSAIPQLSQYNEGYVRRNPCDEASVKLATIANWLLAQIRLRSPDEVVAQLEEFVASDRAPMSEVIALWGLNPTSPIKLTDDVYLVSIADLIPSEARDTVTGIEQNLHAVRSSLPRLSCTAALKRDFVHKEIRCKEGRLSAIAAAMSGFQGGFTIADFIQRHLGVMTGLKWQDPDPDSVRMKEIAKCLCLLNDSSVCELAHWYESPLSTPIIGGVPGWSGQAIEHVFQFGAKPENFDESSARSIVEGFLKLSNAERGRLYVPLSRLNTALRETDNSDKALDLGIALESLVGDGTTLDLSYKVRQRGTFFLGGTPDDKRHNFNRLKKLYDLRSKVAHGRSLDSSVTINGRQTPTDEFLKECCIICARLIRKFIDSGLVSDWDELLLGL